MDSPTFLSMAYRELKLKKGILLLSLLPSKHLRDLMHFQSFLSFLRARKEC